ncbi:MAG: glycosyltransferase [Flavobacteriaceae bacterium]|nr:glycosyltransferase [Flavobacteriaceae bacterium]
MDQSKLVSIIVPTYNRLDYLKLTLQSLLGQTYQNIEIIVVDDGSDGDDNKRYCEQFSKINYIKIENFGGPARPRNIGIDAANGDFIAFTDDDDIWLPKKLENQVAILNEEPAYGLVHSPCKVIDEAGKETGEIIGRPGSPEVKHGDVKLRMMGNWTLMMPTPLLRKELVQIVGYFSEEIPPALEDVEFWVRCSFHTLFYYLDEPQVLYRKHSDNISSDRKKYIPLPLYLDKIIVSMAQGGRIDKEETKLLHDSICRMQLKMIKFHPRRVLSNMNTLSTFWFLKFRNIKLLIKKIMSSK